MEPKQKQHPVVDVTGDGSKVRCCKEQYCIWTWSMNQGKVEVVKQMTRVNIDILEISEIKWTGMGEFNSDDHYIYYCGQESPRKNRVAIIVKKRVWNAVLGCNLKYDRIISVGFQGKPFSITIIQVYAPTSNAEEAEVERFYEELQDLLQLKPKKRCPFHYRGLGCKSRKSRDAWSNSKFGLGVQNEASQKLTEFCQENALVIANTLFHNTRENSTHGHHQMVNTEIILIIFFAAKDGEALHGQQKQEQELTAAQIMNSLLPNSYLSWRK